MQKVSFKVEEGKLVVAVDLNQDGQPLLELKFDIKELPEEAIQAWKDAKAAKA